jgi:transcriptional regulator with XRE-family HTH domain
VSKSLYSDAHQAIVEVLRKTRLQSGLFQQDLAVKLGKSQAYISNIERGERRVDLVEFYEIATALGADPVELFAEIAAEIASRGV